LLPVAAAADVVEGLVDEVGDAGLVEGGASDIGYRAKTARRQDGKTARRRDESSYR
jgi:hypothetical protein